MTISVCSGVSFAKSPPEESGKEQLYRPVNGTWSNWTPDSQHAEEHLRAHSEENSLYGGVVEYK
ncbi:MAG: hypothetical protein P8M65_12495 [Roseibacillus sp.]|nr:hypothetical protein [Roseibacillus sp.]